MKKPVLTTVGVIGACAACCAIPLVIPLMAGVSVAGLASIDWSCLTEASEIAVLSAGLAAALLVGGGIWYYRKRKAAAKCGQSELAAPTDSACGCSQTPAKELK